MAWQRCQRDHEYYTAEVKRKMNLSEETQFKNKCPMLAGRQIMYQIFSFFQHHQNTGAYYELG